MKDKQTITAPLLHAKMYPTGRWTEPCDVACDCGYLRRCATWPAAQRDAWRHDRQHWSGELDQPEQLGLYDD